jgi:hypothetical protein
VRRIDSLGADAAGVVRGDYDDAFREYFDRDHELRPPSAYPGGVLNGLAVDLAHVAAVWTFRRGKIVRVALFTTRAEALEAVNVMKRGPRAEIRRG